MKSIVAMEITQAKRKGLYIRPETRDRLNVYKAQRSLATGRVYSQSDVIDELLALAYRQATLSGGDRQ